MVQEIKQIFNARRGWNPLRDCKNLIDDSSRSECKKGDTVVEYIGRGFGNWTKFGSKYGNPHKYNDNPQWNALNPATGKKYTRDEAVDYYKDDIFGTCPAGGHNVPKADTIKHELKNRNLMCWCSAMDRPHYVGEQGRGKNDRCHGDILASIANE